MLIGSGQRKINQNPENVTSKYNRIQNIKEGCGVQLLVVLNTRNSSNGMYKILLIPVNYLLDIYLTLENIETK